MRLDYYLQQTEKQEVTEWINTTLKAYLKKRPENLTEIEHIIDYLNSDKAPNRLRKMSYFQAKNKSEEWVKSLIKKGNNIVETEEDIKIIRTWDCGMRLVQLISKDAYAREGNLMSHCLTENTPVITDEGTFPIGKLAGKDVNILTRTASGFGKFVKAPIRSYGIQQVVEVLLTDSKGAEHTIYTTDKHRWLAYVTRNKQNRKLVELTTDTLEPGYQIPSVYNKRPLLIEESEKGITLSSIGITHGLTYGDGTRSEGRYAKCDLYGDKALLEPYFPTNSRITEQKKSIGGITVHDLPNSFREVPNINENASYLFGWLSGYFAADGSIDEGGHPKIASTNLEGLNKTEAICQRLGIRVNGIRKETRISNLTEQESVLYTLSFKVGSLPISFYLLDKHAARYKEAELDTGMFTVISITPLDSKEEVFCAEVPDTQCFVLGGNILTGNCVSSYSDKDCIIYSLRDSNNNPHCTMEVTSNEDSVQQIKGKGNGPIHPKYIKYVLDILETLDIEVRPHDMNNLGYKQVSEELWKYIDKYTIGAKYISLKGSRFLYEWSNLNNKE